MTEAAAPLECKKDGLKQMQSGEWTLVLKVHPNDMPPWLLTAPMGQRLAVVVAALDEGAEKKPEQKERRRFDEMPLSQQCALRCQDVGFREWLKEARATSWGAAKEDSNADDAGIAAEVVRAYCRVNSRSELDTDSMASERWNNLEGRFLTETGRIPEARG